MCFHRVPVIVIVIVILRYGSGEGLLKYINVGDKSTMVARLPQQVFLLLVLVTGTTMGIRMYGTELPKSTKSPQSTAIRQDETSGNYPSKKIPHKVINRIEEASNSQIPIPKSDSSNIRRKSFEDSKFASWNQEMNHKNTESNLRPEELKTNYRRDEIILPLLNPLTDRVEPQSISRKDGFVRPQVKETWETSSSSAFYHSLEDSPSLRSWRSLGSFLPSSPISHRLSLSTLSMTSPFSSGEMRSTSASRHSLSSEVSLASADDYPKPALPSSSTNTNSILVSRVLVFDMKLSKDADRIDDENKGSSDTENSMSGLLNEFSKTTQSISTTSTNTIPVSRILKTENKLSKSADQIFEDKIMASNEIEGSELELFSNEFSITTQPISSTSPNNIPVRQILELDDKFSKSGNQIFEDKIMGSSEIEVSKLESFSNKFSKTTQPISSKSHNNIPVRRILILDDKFFKSTDQIFEDKIMGSSEIEVSKLESFSNKFSKTTQPISSTSPNNVPVSRTLESDDKFFKGADEIEDKTMGSSKIGVSRRVQFSNDFPQATTSSLSASIPMNRFLELANKFSNSKVESKEKKIGISKTDLSKLMTISNQLYSFGKEILTTELPTKALSIVHQNKIKSSMQQFSGNEKELKHFDWLTGNRVALTAITLPQTTGFGFSKRYTRDSPDLNMCESFEIGDPVKREFYSPNYPENYPPLTNCVLVLEAEKGELLKLDFRETFELETRTPDGECRFDYLEVRDGQYGFSPKIGTYCDKTFPPEIISQSRHLWLNFHSDDTIEYQGFKAVWSTVPRPNTDAIPMEQEPCIYYEEIPADFELKSDMIKDAKKISETNRVALDCLWILQAKPSMKMQLTFDSFKLDKPNDCSANFLDIFDGETDEPSRVKKFCGSIAEALSTKTNRMYVRLYLEPKAINSSFGALITAVRDKDANQANCKPDEFDCQDATCIALSLRCNSRKNCRFQGDEAQLECGTSFEKQDRSRIVIILVIFSLIMFGMCTAFVFNCVRKLRRDHRIIREHIRQSREDRLDEIGRRTTPCPLSVSRTDLRDGGSESPAGEEVDSSKELIPPATLTTREYTKELTLKMKYGTKEITDIHQSNNVSNATQERLQESSEEPDMCDSSCQTRESLFAPIIPDAILSSPAFSTFGYETIAGPENGLSHKGTPTSDQSYRHHHHQHHPPSLKQTSQTSQESYRKNSQVSGYPISERCSQEGSAQICPKHNPIPAPPGWSLHDPPYPQIVSEPSGCPGSADNSSYRRYQSPKPDHESSIGPSIYQQHQYQYPPPVFTRQNTVGSGERYGSYIYGSGRASSNTASSNATTTSATTTPTTSNTAGSGSPHLATPKHSKTDPRYRAEAVIEVDQKRPFSIESTKSAPDVIATH